VYGVRPEAPDMPISRSNNLDSGRITFSQWQGAPRGQFAIVYFSTPIRALPRPD
jgi:hypothetical protein